MLFSNEKVAAFLNEKFECDWESVGPVPRVEIDFGNGHKLTRTLNGNIATYFCTSEGLVLDVVPGITDPDDFLLRAQVALALDEEAKGKDADALVREWHNAMSYVADRSETELAKLAEAERSSGVPAPELARIFDKQAALRHASDVEAAKKVRHTGWAVERPIRSQLEEETDAKLAEREPRVHALLARSKLDKPTAITKRVYKEILEVDLDDPYLGLAPHVLGGELGRE